MLEKQEFEQILKREDIKNFLLNSSKEAIEKAFGEKVANMKDYDQNNPNHQYDLLEHTIEVMEGLPKEKYLPEDYQTLKTAAFFHDVGKPEDEKEEVIGKIQSEIDDAKRRKSEILDSISQEIEQ